MASDLYPFKFRPIYKDKIWGGQKIKSVLKKDFGNLPNCGESWEISGVKGNVSVVANGDLAGKTLTELIDSYGPTLLGEAVSERFGAEFPLLVKFIDANDDLSIQVHPDDTLAKERHDSFGKTEMWYIFQADEGSSLISGFKKGVTKEEYLEYLENKQLDDILNREPVESDDVFFLPAGRVHTIGKGLLLAEIQQTSDITYRIYDFDRPDANGNLRELHTEEALDAIDFKVYPEYKTLYDKKVDEPVQLVQCPYFTTNRIECKSSIARDYSSIDSFKIIVCMEGAFKLNFGQNESLSVQMGDSLLIPASIENAEFVADSSFKILESFIK